MLHSWALQLIGPSKVVALLEEWALQTLLCLTYLVAYYATRRSRYRTNLIRLQTSSNGWPRLVMNQRETLYDYTYGTRPPEQTS